MFLIVLAVCVYTTLHHVQTPQAVDTTQLEDAQIGNDMVFMAYASQEKAIFYHTFGLFVFDIQNQKIYRSIDLNAIDSHYINASTYTEVLAAKDGKLVYIY